jgi:hypothetical protein
MNRRKQGMNFRNQPLNFFMGQNSGGRLSSVKFKICSTFAQMFQTRLPNAHLTARVSRRWQVWQCFNKDFKFSEREFQQGEALSRVSVFFF